MKPYGRYLQKYCFKFDESKIIFHAVFRFDAPNRLNIHSFLFGHWTFIIIIIIIIIIITIITSETGNNNI